MILLVDSCDQLVSTFIINHVHQTAMQTDNQAPIECAVLLIRGEEKTGIAPIRVIVDKKLDLVVGMVVTINWNGKKTEGEILALNGKF